MAWTETTRRNDDRRLLRHASDCTDEEWLIAEPFLTPLSTVGRPRKHAARNLWNAIQYIAATGCQWGQLPWTGQNAKSSSVPIALKALLLSPAMGCGAHFRAVEPMSPPCKGLGDIYCIIHRTALHRINPAYDTIHRKSLIYMNII